MSKLFYRLASIASVLMLLVPSVAVAAEFVRPTDDSGNVVLSTTETHKNVYVAGGNVTLNSTTMGDAVVAGGTITSDGSIEQDATVAGGTVILNSTVGGDVRVAGGTVVINAQVGGDVLAAGGTLNITEKAKVSGDVAVAGGTVTIDAPIAGKLSVAGGVVVINSKVSGPVVVRNADSVTFGPKAELAGSITVRASQKPVVKDGAKVNTIDYTQAVGRGDKAQWAGVVAYGIIVWILAYLVLALVVAWVAPRRSESFITQVRNRFWTNSAIGLGVLVVVPIIAVVLFILQVGYQLAFLLLSGYVFALFVALALALLWTGNIVRRLFAKQVVDLVSWQTAVIGALVFAVAAFIPVLGGLFCFVVVLANFGQLFVAVKHGFVEHHAEVK